MDLEDFTVYYDVDREVAKRFINGTVNPTRKDVQLLERKILLRSLTSTI